MKLPIDHISASMLRTFEECQYRFKAHYIDDITYEETNPAMEMGLAFETMYLENRESDIKLSKLKEQRILDMFNHLEFNRLKLEIKPQVEFSVPFKKTRLTGRFDGIGTISGGGIKKEEGIIELKTTGNISQWKPERFNYEIQPYFYQFAVNLQFKKKLPIFYIIISTDPHPKVRLYKVEYDEKNMNKIKEKIDNLLQTVEAGVYHTEYCNCENTLYWKECPNTKQQFQIIEALPTEPEN